ncbi:MAG TPA: hypothetical protein VM408_02170 [Methylomirabilota bacterium]|nr:hypothetical protein [Methylomirabilota bacterium]
MKITKSIAFVSMIALAGALSACNASTGSSQALPSVSLPTVSIDPSAAAAGVVAALDQVDTEIDANQSATGLTTEDADALKGFTAQLRTTVQTGDLSAAKPTLDQLSAKVTELDAKLGTDAGARLKAAIAQLQTLLAS